MSQLNSILIGQGQSHDFQEVKLNFPNSRKDRIRYKTFQDLWSKGFYITEGEKFGADFLAYPGDPFEYHANYVVICSELDPQTEMTEEELVAKCRLGTTVKKTVLLARLNKNNNVIYKSLIWTE